MTRKNAGQLEGDDARPAVVDACCAGRLGEARGRVYGTLPVGVGEGAILDRALAV